jgi:predicted ATPase
MLTTLAVANYRSLLDLSVPLGPLNVITGPNGSGKSNLYKALRLVAETARAGVVNALAHEGGLESTFWAGPEELSRAMRRGDVPVQGALRKGPRRLRLGFAGDEFGYAIALGLPGQTRDTTSFFTLDPEIKHECIWAGDRWRPASVLVERDGALVKVRSGREWNVVSNGVREFESLFEHVADPQAAPEVFRLREAIRGWRFYDHFRTDGDAPARHPQIGTQTPVLHHDGRDLAAALQTIREIGDGPALDDALEDAFPGARLEIDAQAGGRFSVALRQSGLLRPLNGAELSDGTLRYLLWMAALLTPRPPQLMVLNEPETSLHPDLLPALARLVGVASRRSQVWIVSHASRLVSALEALPECRSIHLEKDHGATSIAQQGALERAAWRWPE